MRKEPLHFSENLHENRDSPELDLVMTESAIPSGHAEPATTQESQQVGAEIEKVPDYHNDRIDLTKIDNTTDTIDNTKPYPQNCKATQESYISFSGMINTDDQKAIS